MAEPTLSRFTPSLMSHELLERLFVAREPTLEAIMARVDAAAESPERNHTLLVGPRGAGKTHLVSLVAHRVEERRAAGARLQLAWLPEDAWTIASYRHLLAAIAGAVMDDVSSTVAELETALTRQAEAAGPIVVIVENLDRVMAAIDDDGQQRLRHLLQAERSLLLVATSTRLDRSLSDQASPFYGFFTTTQLEPFNVNEAAAMLKAIADEREDERLVQYLDEPEGRARLRTIAHLAGGQPRMWAALASALTVSGLGDLIDLLLTRFDDLTPYYQQQLDRLSPAQRLVVAELAAADRPLNVRELAERLEIGQRSLGKTMTELGDRGWVAPTASPLTARLDKRKTHYELAEPLARLAFQIKEARGTPLRIVVDFLKHWFDPSEIEGAEGLASDYRVLVIEGHAHDPVVAVTRQLERLPVTRAPAVDLLGKVDDALAALDETPELFLGLPVPVRGALEQRLGATPRTEVRHTIHVAALVEFDHARDPIVSDWIRRAEELVRSGEPLQAAVARTTLAAWLGRAWRFAEASETIAAAADVLGRGSPAVLSARGSLASSLWRAGRGAEAIELQTAVLADNQRVFGPDDRRTLRSRHNLAVDYLAAGQLDEAIDRLVAVVNDAERLFGRDDRAALSGRHALACAYWSAQRRDESVALLEAVVVDTERVLGVDADTTLTSRSNLATTYLAAGRADEAWALQADVLDKRERVLGPSHPDTLTSRHGLAVAAGTAGRRDESAALAARVLADRERLLGANHPDTRLSRELVAGLRRIDSSRE